ncbi:LysR family transcriptional regulator [Virgibacillus doumboii]|uniref:LysR family transcriptional regulator n=1 Tax=Virgibacillus doumboii TaxID=2697503 RepID=UPI0013DEB98C|nr:LysR family transcriptional regulator [Virgibacillus doumboii]
MRVGNLETFCQVVEEGSISKVAKINYITQPAITKQIRQLESTYGTKLFERVNGNLRVTKNGEKLYELAKKIVFQYDQSFQIINELKGEENKNLKIGSSFTIGEYFLPATLGEFKKIHPDIEIALEVSSTPNILESIKENKAGIALVEGIVKDESLTVSKFAEDELVLVCSPNHSVLGEVDSVTLDDLSSEKFIWREENSGLRLLVEDILEKNDALENINIYMELGSTQAIKGAVEADLGIALLSEIVVERELKNGSLRKIFIENVDFKRDLWFVKQKDSFISSIEKEFKEFLTDLRKT